MPLPNLSGSVIQSLSRIIVQTAMEHVLDSALAIRQCLPVLAAGSFGPRQVATKRFRLTTERRAPKWSLASEKMVIRLRRRLLLS